MNVISAKASSIMRPTAWGLMRAARSAALSFTWKQRSKEEGSTAQLGCHVVARRRVEADARCALRSAVVHLQTTKQQGRWKMEDSRH
jgi:hypothetical protein